MYATKNTAHVLLSDPIAIRYSAYTSTGLDPQLSNREKNGSGTGLTRVDPGWSG